MTAGAVVVGVDGSSESLRAVHWAVEEARARRTAVRVVRAYLNQLSAWPMMGDEGYSLEPPPLDPYQAELDEAVAYVRDRLGAENVSGWLAHASAADALLAEAEDAALVAVGTRSRSKLSAAVLGSVATAVVSKAPCPVVVVRGEASDGPVVVGTDGSADSARAVEFGFEEAARSGAELIVAYCWQPQERHDKPIENLRELLTGWLAESLAPYREKYPTVVVHSQVAEGRAAERLIELSQGASLVVVGSRGRGGVKGLLLGSVSQSLLHHADCPVAVVREPDR